MQSFLLLLPDFALIALGVALRRFGRLEDGFWAGVEKLVYFVFFPALLFHALARAPIDLSAAGPMFAVGLLTMAAGFALALLGRPLMGLGEMAFASRVQCAYRFNTYIGIAVAGTLNGAAGVAASKWAPSKSSVRLPPIPPPSPPATSASEAVSSTSHRHGVGPV